MSGDLVEFNIEAAESSTYEELPEGQYVCVCTKATVKENKNGSGKHLGLSFRVMTGPYTGRYIFHTIQLSHTNTNVEKWGRSELKSLANTLGITQLSDSSQLLALPLVVSLRMKNDGKIRVDGYSQFQGWEIGNNNDVPF